MSQGHPDTPTPQHPGTRSPWRNVKKAAKWLAKRFRVSRSTDRKGEKHYFFGIKGRF